MRDYIDIGPVPPEESCQQVGTPNYDPVAARQECNRYLKLLRKVLGDEPEGARLAVKSHPHDFGTYQSVCCYYDPALPASVEYALKCESEGPLTWEDTDVEQEAESELSGNSSADT